MLLLFVVAFVSVLPGLAFGQAATDAYLNASGVPIAGFSPGAPTGALTNLDSERNSDPGLTLSKTAASATENDPTKYQLWARSASPLALEGPASLIVTASMRDHASDKAGQLTAYLLDCNPQLSSCETIATGSVSASPWSSAGTWETRTISFGSVSYELGAGRRLSVKLLVNASVSEDDMWIAYDAAAYPSRLTYTEAGTGTTTTTTQATTTTTEPTTTTTTVAATTTTTEPATTTTVPATTTTTVAATTTTTEPATTTTEPATTTTTVAATTTTQADDGSPDTPSSGEQSPPSGSGPESSGSGTIDPEDPSAEGIDESDLALAQVTESGPPGDQEPESGLLHTVDLILPDSVAALVVSPFVILEAIVEAMVSTGLAVSLPAFAAGTGLGILIIFVDRRKRWEVAGD